MHGLGSLTPTECAQVFAAGDMAYFKSAGCADSQGNDALITAKKSELDTKTYVLIGLGVIGTGLTIYLALKK